MSIPVPLKGFGGGGANLNFKVVGNLQPTSPRENTIWLNTDQEITSWIFSAAEPETPEEGMVWFSVGTSSPVEFNALKKNAIQVYPLSAKQYVSDAWQDLVYFMYQDGMWSEVDSTNYLYNAGDEFEDITGGLIVNEQGYNVSAPGSLATLTRGTTDFTCTCEKNNRASTVTFANKIDLTDISTVHFKVKAIGETAPEAWVGSSTTDYISECTLASKELSVSDDLMLDVSAVSGAHYVGLMFLNWGATTRSATIEAIWMD